MTRYTLSAPHQHEQIIQRSRFLAHACAVADAEEAMSVIAELSIDTATHNCWATRIGNHYRFSDDGEPAGTAGRPILAAIDGQAMDNLVVVVTRWFGGIKLGTGGLTRAYGGCAAECLRTADREPVIDFVDMRCHVGFALESPIRAALVAFDAEDTDQRYDEHGVHLRIRVPKSTAEPLCRHLTDLSRGSAIISVVE